MLWRAAEDKLPEFTATDLALTGWSMATLKFEPDGLYDRVSDLAILKMSDFGPQAITNICWATATLRKENDALVRNASMVALKKLQSEGGLVFRPHEYSTLAWSMVITQAREEALFTMIGKHVVARVSEFGPQELTNTVWAFAALGVRTDGLFEAVGEECRLKLHTFNTQNITNVAWSYTHLNVGSGALLEEVATTALARMREMNVHDLAQLALSLCFLRRSGEDKNAVFGNEKVTLSLVKEVAIAMTEKLRTSALTYPDDAWIVHDLTLTYMDEEQAMTELRGAWPVLDAMTRRHYEEVSVFFNETPMLARAMPVGAVVHSTHVHEYERGFKALDLRSLGIKYSGKLMQELRLIDPDLSFAKRATNELVADRDALLLNEPGAGSQTWCVFRYSVFAYVYGAPVYEEELEGIKVRSCGNDETAFKLLDAPREAHLVSVKLSNDRLNHRRRDAEFRAMAHTAGIMRTLIPDVDMLMAARARWGDRVQGWLQMYVTEVPCLSCLGAMVQFSKRFPKVSLHVSFPGCPPALP